MNFPKQLCRRIKSKFCDENSLKSKISRDLAKGLFLAFIVGYIIFLLFHMFIIGLSFVEAFLESTFYIANIILVLIIADYIILRSIDKHIIKRLIYSGNEIKEIREGNLSKRVTSFGNDEIDQRSKLINTLVRQLEALIEREKKYSLIDPLTSCYNRRALNLKFEDLFSESKREKLQYSIAIIDIDHFKKINDNYGHKTGDEVLVNLSKIFKQVLRHNDTVYRIGGEEFLILFAKVKKINLGKIISRLREKIPEEMKHLIPQIKQRVTISGGFVMTTNYKIVDKSVFHKMIEDADKLLYKAKRGGRDKILG